MFDFLFGSNREKIQEAVSGKLEKYEKKGRIVTRITDAHTSADLEMSLRGGGLFSETRGNMVGGASQRNGTGHSGCSCE